jgi:aerobic carbon-monoxide dehydrogenase medium subunit
MIPAAFEYHAPKTLDEALRLVERHGDEAKLLAGGHSLLPLMRLRLATPRYVIDIGHLRGMSYIREENGQIAIGALTTHSEIENSALLATKCPLLCETASHIGDVQVRNRGTIGGSLAHADPGADYPAAILALDAELIAANTSGTRTIPARDFFVDMLTTQLHPGEILTQIRVAPRQQFSGAAYEKLHQPASGFAIVGVAANLLLGKGGKTIEQAAIGITGLAAKAFRAEAVERALIGKTISEKLIEEASRNAAEGVEPLSDLHASGEYRREMARVFTRRAISRAVEAARGGPSRGKA